MKAVFKSIVKYLTALVPAYRVFKSPYFDSNAYLKMYPALHELPWYLMPALHWVLFGQTLGDMAAAPTHLADASLQALLYKTGPLSSEDKTALLALDSGDIEDAKLALPRLSPAIALRISYIMAVKYMDVAPANGVLERLTREQWRPPSPNAARQMLDLARACGRPVGVHYAALVGYLQDLDERAKTLLARLPLSLENLPTDLTVAATRNEGGWSVPQCTQNGKIAYRVRVPMPIYWVEPQRSHDVLGPVTQIFTALLQRLQAADVQVIAIWATPIYDISQEITHGLPCLSYHTVCRPEAAQLGDVHFKESYLPDYFTVDKLGYSGWSSVAACQTIPPPSQTARRYVDNIRSRYLEAGRSKYVQGAAALPVTCFIFVALQVPDDTVGSLAYMPRESWVRTVIEMRLSCPVVIKRHPKDNSVGTDILLAKFSELKNVYVVDAPIQKLIAQASVVVTVNSGVGFEALIAPKPVITCGATDYAVATKAARTEGQLRQAIKQALSGNHPISAAHSESFVHHYLTQKCCTLDDLSVALRALNLR